MKSFGDYPPRDAKLITVIKGDFFPDSLRPAMEIYKQDLDRFGELLGVAADSVGLLRMIYAVKNQKQRVQLLRVFRKYVSPDTSVEMLKKASNAGRIVTDFGGGFRLLSEVRAAHASRPVPDEAMVALLNEYRERGSKGYGLTGTFFAWFAERFTDFTVEGPKGAGRDIQLAKVLPGYVVGKRPVDFVIREQGVPLVIGLARYDSDRGGAQEDDRTGGYRNVCAEVFAHADGSGLNRLKLLFLNDGPGLLLGSMWADYTSIEAVRPGRIMVATLVMLNERLTADWIRS